ncbi:MAG: hypothetical protein H8E37_04240 [Planctomycetes bacterium]|nr:hypothetical protein [Planctomycetota bacterium]
MSNSTRRTPEPRNSLLVARRLILAATFLCLVSGLAIRAQAERPKRVWAVQTPVRDKSDTGHLNWRQLRTWKVTDLDPLPFRRTLPKEFKPLWESVLSSEDRELRRNALLAIRRAQQGGYADFSNLADAVRKTFNRPDLRAITKIDAARTLVTLNARAAADDFIKRLDESPELRQVAEQAFADWDYQPARALWMKRLKRASEAPRSHVTLAIRGLAQVGHKAAVEDIRGIVLSEELDSGLRLMAARALAELQTDGLEEMSRDLLASKGKRSGISALLAASLLRRHTGKNCEQILSGLLEHASPPVAAKAWERIDELNPDSIPERVLEETLNSRDARLRLLAVQNCSHRSALHAEWLIAALDDHHPDVRCLARHTLLDRDAKADKAGRQDRRDQIRVELTRAFASDNTWRGLEQACLLSAELDHKPVVAAIANLLPHDRIELSSAAAFSLKELAVAEVLPQMLAYAQRLDGELIASNGGNFKRVEVVQTHLLESFGELRYQPADQILRTYIPKGGPRFQTPYSRMAAIRSVALLSHGEPDEELVTQLRGRMFDRSLIMPEWTEVVTGCALAFGIMKLKSSLKDLRKLAAEMGPNQPPGRAAFWGIQQLTGEPIPPQTQLLKSRARWFLTPLPADH